MTLTSSKSSPSSLTKIIFSIICLFLATGLSTYSGYLTLLIPSKFYSALDQGNNKNITKEDLQNNVKNLLLYEVSWIIPFAAFVECLIYLIKSLIHLLLRDYLTRKLVKKYMRGINFYKISESETNNKTKCDNPDQRITEDLNDFSRNCSEHFNLISKTSMGVIWYSYKTYQASGIVACLLIYAFAIFGVIINAVILPKQSEQTQKLAQCNGTYRSQMLRIKNYKETIAIANSNKLEESIAFKYFNKSIFRQKILIYFTTGITFTSSLVSFSGAIMSYIIVSPAVIEATFDGTFDNDDNMTASAFISMYAGIYMTLIYNFTSMIQEFPKLGMTIGYYKRIKMLDDELNEIERERELREEDQERKLLLEINKTDIFKPENKEYSNNSVSETTQLLDNSDSEASNSRQSKNTRVSSVVIASNPDTNNLELLIRNLNLNFKKSKIFLKGASGTGKSTIVKVLTGVLDRKFISSPFSSSSISSSSSSNFKNCLIFPQNYTQLILPRASLLEQISHPFLYKENSSNSNYSKENICEKISEIFKTLDLNLPFSDNSVINLDKPTDKWLSSYSNGELQRIILSRALFWEPEYLIIDETMSNLDKNWIFKIFKLLEEKKIKYLTISHDLELEKFHDVVIDLDAS